jgi:hypothetical protein
MEKPGFAFQLSKVCKKIPGQFYRLNDFAPQSMVLLGLPVSMKWFSCGSLANR